MPDLVHGRTKAARREGAPGGRSVVQRDPCYGLVVVSVKVPLPLYEYTRQR
jgi:hypothetical protein